AHGTNLVLELPWGPDPQVLADAEVVVHGRFVSQRLAGAPMEGNAIVVTPTDGGLDVFVSSQNPFAIQRALCEALDLDPARVRVRCPAVGGGFGPKIGVYPEHLLVAAIARRLDRPVRWSEGRSENLVAMHHGRGQIQ